MKERILWKTKLRIVSVLALALLLSMASLTVTQAASAKSQAMSAYKAYMEKESSAWEFAVIYLDKDSIPELVINNGKIFSYKKAGGMSLLQDDYEFDYKKYYKKKGVIYSDIIPGAVMDYDVWYYQRVSGGKLVTICRVEKYNSGAYKYYNNKYKTITKSKCNKLIKKYAGSKKITKIKYYKNTVANRNKYLK